jgi:peptidase M48-like protein
MAPMDVAEVTPNRRGPRPERTEGCPRCGEPWSAGPLVTAPSFGGRVLRRCRRCGTRAADGTPAPRLVFTCEACGLPFLDEQILAHGEQRCGPCTLGLVPPELPDRDVAAAAENEVRAALATRWRFVTSSSAQPYLDRIARHVAGRVTGAPTSPRVVLVEASEHRTLALPSGTLVVSTGLLAFLEDEAELAFLLGHEIAHAASGEVAVRLVRLGFQATARERSATDGLCWSDAALDLVRLGYGRKREHDADACALRAMLDLEYEPQSASRYLQRLHSAISRGDDAVAETEVAHPTPFDRMRRIERALGARVAVTSDVPRVNREVFRRALAPAALAASLVKTDLDAPQPLPWGMTALLERQPGVLSVRIILAVGLAAATLVALATWLAR